MSMPKSSKPFVKLSKVEWDRALRQLPLSASRGVKQVDPNRPPPTFSQWLRRRRLQDPKW